MGPWPGQFKSAGTAPPTLFAAIVIGLLVLVLLLVALFVFRHRRTLAGDLVEAQVRQALERHDAALLSAAEIAISERVAAVAADLPVVVAIDGAERDLALDLEAAGRQFREIGLFPARAIE